VDTRVVAGRHRRPRPGPGRHRRRSQPGRWAAPVLAALVVVGVGGVGAVNALLDHGSGDTASPRPSTAVLGEQVTRTPVPSSSTPSTGTPSTGTTTTTPTPAPSAASRPPVKPLPWLAVTVTGRRAWVSVAVPGGRTLAQGLLRHGRSVRFPHRRPLAVVIGDAGAVRLVLRHHAHAPAGRRGQVLRFTVR